MKTKLLLLFCMLIFLFNDGCMYAIRYDGSYNGKIIDEATREPIEGVVVLGVWYKEYRGAAGTVSEFYDARETLTDKNGEFEIPGQGLKVMTNVAPMDVLIFKAGYTNLSIMTWDELKRTVKVEDNKAVIRLRKLTMEQRKKRLFGKENIPDEKQRLLIKESNKESIEIGLSPYQEVK